MTSDLRYRRILLKVSGEALMGESDFGLEPDVLARTAQDITRLTELGVEVAVVVGGGNLFRGAALQAAGMDRVVGDHMGMLATIMNGLALADTLRRSGLPVALMSAGAIPGVVDGYARDQAVEALTAGKVLVLGGGIGNPFFTTDTTACLRGIELGVEIVVKATNVDGVYTADPKKSATAQRFVQVNFDEVLQRSLGVMDLPAICLCRDHDLAIRVLDIAEPDALVTMVHGGDIGTLIGNAEQVGVAPILS